MNGRASYYNTQFSVILAKVLMNHRFPPPRSSAHKPSAPAAVVSTMPPIDLPHSLRSGYRLCPASYVRYWRLYGSVLPPQAVHPAASTANPVPVSPATNATVPPSVATMSRHAANDRWRCDALPSISTPALQQRGSGSAQKKWFSSIFRARSGSEGESVTDQDLPDRTSAASRF